MPSVTRFLAASLFAALCLSGAAAPRLELALDREFYIEGQQNNLYLKTTVHTGDLPSESSSPASNIVFLVDRSGSMEGEKLAALKTSLQGALANFSSHDRIALVAFGSSVETLIPPTQLDQLSNASAKIANLTTDGGSALFDGLSRAREEILKNAADHPSNRIFLICDGPPNKGPLDPEQFATLAASIARQSIAITSFGLGSDAPLELLDQISSPSNSPTRTIPEPSQLAAAMAAELQPLNPPIGKNAVLEIDFHRALDIEESIGREAEIGSRRVTFHLGSLLANQEITTVVQATLNASATFFNSNRLASASLSYQPTDLPDAAPRRIEAEIGARFVQGSSHSFDSIQPHVYQTVCEYETSDIIRESLAAHQEGKSKKALRDLKRLARNIRSIAQDIPELQAQASLEQINQTIDAIEQANESTIETRALIKTLFPNPSPQADDDAP
ncbi:VWA domain-containing protein [Pelagicoccus sp. SDUM812005]|uniref:vWA domain-containing protein n=1 Tax=Pelagicoccus sp. SDUM812005 TaxID=3041257 RepID=UPI00280D6760|nr:VWA domain-containing protein [Pelagicoccus sp. SDUM812005]MDQ8181911.1 VWA domain-containing protein [Pelagicoccus sp. SDUM812005]